MQLEKRYLSAPAVTVLNDGFTGGSYAIKAGAEAHTAVMHRVRTALIQ